MCEDSLKEGHGSVWSDDDGPREKQMLHHYLRSVSDLSLSLWTNRQDKSLRDMFSRWRRLLLSFPVTRHT